MSGSTSLVSATPDFVANATGFGGQDVRLGTMANSMPGLFAVGDFAVTQRAATANMSVDIAQGRAFVDPGGATHQGLYAVRRTSGTAYNTSADGGYSWIAADATNPRIDLLCIEVKDTEMDASGVTGWRFRIVDGTPNAGATTVANRTYWPAVPTGCLALAAIRIPAAATTITTANILSLNILGGPRVSVDTAIQSFTASGTIDALMGRTITIDASAATLTLPAAVVGMRLEVWNISTTEANTATIQRAGADTINGAATSVVLAAGARVPLVCRSAGVWQALWENGQQLAAGYTEAATDSAGAGDKLSFAIVGDGLTPVQIAFAGHAYSSGAAATGLFYTVRDGAAGTGTIYQEAYVSSAGINYVSLLKSEVTVPAWTGSRTFYLNLGNSAGAPTAYDASVNAHRWMRAAWAPGARTS